MCARKGALMTTEMIPAGHLNIEAEKGALGLYQFGAKTAKHYFCKTCGIYPFHETARKAGHFRVNLGCIKDLETEHFEADLFDGKHLL